MDPVGSGTLFCFKVIVLSLNSEKVLFVLKNSLTVSLHTGYINKSVEPGIFICKPLHCRVHTECLAWTN
jgi:hypothetical protein